MGFEDQYDQEFAPGWRPEQGDSIQGIVVDKGERDGGYGTYPILTIRRITGPEGSENLTADLVAVHCSKTALSRWVEEKDPQIGDRVGFRDNGKKMSKVGQEYHDYSKALQRAGEVPARLRPNVRDAPAVAAAATDFSPSANAADYEPF